MHSRRMNGKMTRRYVVAATLLKSLVLIIHLLPIISISITPIPPDPASLERWTITNILPFSARSRDQNLDPALKRSENSPKVIKVRKTGPKYKTITQALDSVPVNNTKRTIIWIGGGEYEEKITINSSKPFVTLYGEKGNMPKLTFNATAAGNGIKGSATVIVEADYFMAVNIIFENTAPHTHNGSEGPQAPAMRISGDKASFFNCHFLAFQHTLCDEMGYHFFKDCYIEGTYDFVFGNAKSFFLKTELHMLAKDGSGVFTAHARERDDEDTGYNFVHAALSGVGVGGALLGQAWKPKATVIFSYTFMGPVVDPLGWSNYGHIDYEQTLFFAEYMCKGPGANSKGRVKFAKMLTETDARPFLDIEFIRGSTWLLAPPKKVS